MSELTNVALKLENGVESELNNKTIISTKNCIPHRRDITRKDIDAFVEKIKKAKAEKVDNNDK